MVQKRCFYEWSCRVPLIVRFPDRWKSGTCVETPTSLLDLLPTFCDLAGADDLLPHDGSNLISLLSGDDPGRTVYAQAHEAVGMPCIMARRGNHKYNYIHGFSPQLFDLKSDSGEWKNLAGKPEHAGLAASFRDDILDRFDPEAMAVENLASLRNRALIRDVMKAQGRTWAHTPIFNPQKGALDQYL
ncbi:MAG: hypothetical protein HOH43_03925 [Candidatus Latescibacteria bacterium]|nr:hypothetical protein [Candidatus Latescibacterota bacterium]